MGRAGSPWRDGDQTLPKVRAVQRLRPRLHPLGGNWLQLLTMGGAHSLREPTDATAPATRGMPPQQPFEQAQRDGFCDPRRAVALPSPVVPLCRTHLVCEAPTTESIILESARRNVRLVAAARLRPNQLIPAQATRGHFEPDHCPAIRPDDRDLVVWPIPASCRLVNESHQLHFRGCARLPGMSPSQPRAREFVIKGEKGKLSIQSPR